MSTKSDPPISTVGGGDRRATIASTSASSAADARWEPALERIRALMSAPRAELERLDAAIRVVVDTLDVPYGKILALEASTPWLIVQAGVGWQPGTVGQARVPLGSRSQAGLTLRIGSSVVCADLPRARFADATLLRRHGVVSGVSAVIGAPEQPYGVLSVHTTTRRDFTASETRFICRAAALVGAGVSQRRPAYVGSDGARDVHVSRGG